MMTVKLNGTDAGRYNNSNGWRYAIDSHKSVARY